MFAAILFTAVILAAGEDARTLAAAAIEAANEFKLDAADDTARRAYLAALACGDLAAQSLAIDASAVVARLRGDRDRALDESMLALALAELSGDPIARARSYNNLGRIATELSGDLQTAEQHYRRALDLSADDLPLRARVLNNIGNLERMRSRRTAALEAFRSALHLSERARDSYGQLAAEHNIGLLFAEQNDPAQALPHLLKALAIERRMKSATAARTLLSIAEAHRALGDQAEAARYLRLASGTRDEAALSSILLRQADMAIDGHRFTEAIAAIRRSRAVSERLGDRATVALADAYDAKLALSRGQSRNARTLAERAATTATSLHQFDVVAQAESIRGMAALRDNDRHTARAAFDSAIRAVEEQRKGLAGGALARQRFFGRELYPYEQMIALLVDDNDAGEALRYAELKRARSLRRGSRLQPAQTRGAVVSFTMAGERVVAIVSNGRPRIVILPAARAEIARIANEFANQLAQRDNNFLTTASDLYDLLWKPLHLAESRVRIVPDEELWRVPFAALRDDRGRFLVESVTISYAPAVSEIGDDAMTTPHRILLADNLPAHPTEIPELAKLYANEDVTVVEAAGESTIKRNLAKRDIIHIAAHGVFDDRDPLESHLQLRPDFGEDGRLTARELMSASMSASTLVLSSCDSAAGTVAPGEGLISLTWAALVAGCSTIVASQWQVASKTTTDIMVAFHRQLRSGAGAAESLQAAQIAAARRRESAHPYYWAAFVVVGR